MNPRRAMAVLGGQGGRSTPSEASFATHSTLTLGAPLGRTLNTLELAFEEARVAREQAQDRTGKGPGISPSLPEFQASWRFNKILEGCSNSPFCYLVSMVGAIVVVCIGSTVIAALWKTKPAVSPTNKLATGNENFNPVLPVNESTTSRSPRDQTLVPCTGLSCEWALRVIKWKVHDWGSCTNHCGYGVMRRKVECRSGGVAYCRLSGQEPSRQKECQQYDGCSWEVGNWSLCSNACGAGTQHRDVRCTSKRTRDDCLVNGGEPTSRRQCQETVGCSWILGPWGACSSHCGSGEQRRALHCKGDHSITMATGSTTAANGHASTKSWTPYPGITSTTSAQSRRSAGNAQVVATGMDGGSQKGMTVYPADVYRGAVGRRLTTGCESVPDDLMTRWTVRSCVGVNGCRWRIHDWGSCSGTCSAATQTRNISCANGSMADCRRRGKTPERTSHCIPSGCNAGAFWFGCACVPSDTGNLALAVAGALNALSGWTMAAASWQIMVVKLPRERCAGNPKAVALLPLGSIVFAGFSALMVSNIFGCSPAGCVSHARGIVVDSGQFTAGLAGMAVWLIMLPGSKAQMENSISSIMLWACAGFLFLGLLAISLHGRMGTLLAVAAEQLYRFGWAKLWPSLFAVLLLCLLVSALGCAYMNLGLKTHCSSLEDRIHRVLGNL